PRAPALPSEPAAPQASCSSLAASRSGSPSDRSSAPTAHDRARDRAVRSRSRRQPCVASALFRLVNRAALEKRTKLSPREKQMLARHQLARPDRQRNLRMRPAFQIVEQHDLALKRIEASERPQKPLPYAKRLEIPRLGGLW